MKGMMNYEEQEIINIMCSDHDDILRDGVGKSCG